MYKKKKNKKIIIIFGVVSFLVLFLLVGYFTKDNRKISSLEIYLKDKVAEIQKFFIKTSSSTNLKSTNLLENRIKALENDLASLKQLLNLNQTLTEYIIENATVLSRNRSFWYESIIIDKGLKDGVKKNMAVITENGLLGKITYANNNSSELRLITSCNENFQISLLIHTNQGDVHALLSGYDHEKNKAIISDIDKDKEILVNQIVTTSGLGGIFPSGIYVGEIFEVESDNYAISKRAYVKLKQDFNTIRYVSVLKDVNND